jgi:hypothetical protein
MTTRTKPKVLKCYRCAKRCRNAELWNVDHVAGVELGVICPSCQTVEEDLEAQVNLAMGATEGLGQLHIDNPDGLMKYVEYLIAAYPKPDLMRAKADRIAAVRTDEFASEVVRLMRQIANRMDEIGWTRLMRPRMDDDK